MSQSRRVFLKNGMLISTSVAFSSIGCSHVSQYFKNFWGPIDLTTHTVIVGSGLAGLSCAYKMKQKNLPYKIFEASHRVGGRAYTLNDFHIKASKLELGGEFIEDHHESIKQLAKNLSFNLVRAKEEKKFFIEEGSQALAERLKDRVCSVIPEQILKLNHQLISIKEVEKSYVLTFSTGQELVRVRTNRVILALPLTQLQNIEGLFGIATGVSRYTHFLQIEREAKLIFAFDKAIKNTKSPSRFMLNSNTALWQPCLEHTSNEQFLLTQLDSSQLSENLLKLAMTSGIDEVELLKKSVQSKKIKNPVVSFGKKLSSFPAANYYIQDWSKVKFIEMSRTTLNTSKKLKLQNYEIAKNIYAIGEHMSPEFIGTMNGAIESGQKLAEML